MMHDSTRTIESAVCPGVRFTIARMSLARRLQFSRKVRELGGRLEFHAAGSSADDQLEAAILSGEIEKLYLEWGLLAVDGLTIDGRVANTASLIAAGPEDLAREAVKAIQRECSLTDEERKN